ncbi:MAG: hypothetical protein ABSB82_19100 [Terriglobia bacterium]
MTDADKKFMTEMGIKPCTLDDPFPNLLREQEPEPEFVPPKSLWEYLVRYPTGIRMATERAAEELGLVPPDGGLDSWAQGLTDMFISFVQLGLEDVVEMFTHPVQPCHGDSESERFHDYIRQRVEAALPVLLRDDPIF